MQIVVSLPVPIKEDGYFKILDDFLVLEPEDTEANVTVEDKLYNSLFVLLTSYVQKNNSPQVMTQLKSIVGDVTRVVFNMDLDKVHSDTPKLIANKVNSRFIITDIEELKAQQAQQEVQKQTEKPKTETKTEKLPLKSKKDTTDKPKVKKPKK